VTVVAEMDFYPKYQPWVFLTPTILGACESGKLCVDASWNAQTSRFADVSMLRSGTVIERGHWYAAGSG
jgi:hypothetical protein